MNLFKTPILLVFLGSLAGCTHFVPLSQLNQVRNADNFSTLEKGVENRRFLRTELTISLDKKIMKAIDFLFEINVDKLEQRDLEFYVFNQTAYFFGNLEKDDDEYIRGFPEELKRSRLLNLRNVHSFMGQKKRRSLSEKLNDKRLKVLFFSKITGFKDVDSRNIGSTVFNENLYFWGDISVDEAKRYVEIAKTIDELEGIFVIVPPEPGA